MQWLTPTEPDPSDPYRVAHAHGAWESAEHGTTIEDVFIVPKGEEIAPAPFAAVIVWRNPENQYVSIQLVPNLDFGAHYSCYINDFCNDYGFPSHSLMEPPRPATEALLQQHGIKPIRQPDHVQLLLYQQLIRGENGESRRYARRLVAALLESPDIFGSDPKVREAVVSAIGQEITSLTPAPTAIAPARFLEGKDEERLR